MSVVAVANVETDALADEDAASDGDALADPDGTTTPPASDALAALDGDDDATVEADGADEPAALDPDGEGVVVVGLLQAANTPNTSTNNMMNEKRCFIRSHYS